MMKNLLALMVVASTLSLAACIDEEKDTSNADPQDPAPTVNRAPEISGSPATTVQAGTAYSFTPAASDADGDPLTFSAIGMPAWASVDAATGRIGGTPGDAHVGTSGDITLAYQTVAGAPCAPVDGVKEPVGAEEAVLLFHPGLQRMAAFWWRDGSLLPLANGSIAAAQTPLVDPPGFFQTSPDGLMFSPMPADINAGIKAARLMEALYVPRATTNPDRPLILIGPASKRDPKRLTIIAFSILPPITPAR